MPNKKYLPGPIMLGMLLLSVVVIIATYGEKTIPFFQSYLNWAGPFQMGLTCLLVGFGSIATGFGFIMLLHYYDEWRQK